jgi:hypothetical protein
VIYLVALLVGAIVGGTIVLLASLLIMSTARRQVERRMGYVDLTTLSASHEGRDASAEPNDDDELSGGLTSQPPSHLRMIKGGRR